MFLSHSSRIAGHAVSFKHWLVSKTRSCIARGTVEGRVVSGQRTMRCRDLLSFAELDRFPELLAEH